MVLTGFCEEVFEGVVEKASKAEYEAIKLNCNLREALLEEKHII